MIRTRQWASQVTPMTGIRTSNQLALKNIGPPPSGRLSHGIHTRLPAPARAGTLSYPSPTALKFREPLHHAPPALRIAVRFSVRCLKLSPEIRGRDSSVDDNGRPPS